MGTAIPSSPQQLAVSLGHLLCTARAEMGSRVHRAPQTEGRKPVNGAIQPRECVTVSAGYDRWAAAYDSYVNATVAIDDRAFPPLWRDLVRLLLTTGAARPPKYGLCSWQCSDR